MGQFINLSDKIRVVELNDTSKFEEPKVHEEHTASLEAECPGDPKSNLPKAILGANPKKEKRLFQVIPSKYSGKLAPCGRNDPCPCGSGRKFKKCCLSLRRTAMAKKNVAQVVKQLEGIASRITELDGYIKNMPSHDRENFLALISLPNAGELLKRMPTNTDDQILFKEMAELAYALKKTKVDRT